MYECALNALIRSNLDLTPTSYRSTADEKKENLETIKALQHLNERLKALGKRKGVRMATHGGTVRAWPLEHATVRDMQVYVGKRRLYLRMPCGALTPFRLRALDGITNSNGVTAQELSFIARFI